MSCRTRSCVTFRRRHSNFDLAQHRVTWCDFVGVVVSLSHNVASRWSTSQSLQLCYLQANYVVGTPFFNFAYVQATLLGV